VPEHLEAWWKSWHGRERFRFPLPEDWSLEIAGIADAPTLSDSDILDRLAAPVGTPALRELAHGRSTACIAIDDLNRPTETFRILPPILDELEAAGIPADRILVIASLGTHRPLTRQDFLKKVGPAVLKRVRVYNHNPYLNLEKVGTTSFGTEVRVNGLWAASDLRIGIGTLAPHGYAGFSGGGKIVLPGLSSWETVLANHKPANNTLSGHVGRIAGNTRRQEIDEAGALAGLAFVVNTVSNAEGRTAELVCGHPVEAFRTAARFARRIYATKLPRDVDVGVFNAFPKDTELLQALNALSAWNPVAGHADLVREGGTIVLITAASEGHGWLGLINPGGPLHERRDRHPVYREMLRSRRMFFLSPNLEKPDLLDHYPPEVELFHEWEPLRQQLETLHGSRARVGFLPCGPLQIAAEDLHID
jgi:nickel-dependent lactate racemase